MNCSCKELDVTEPTRGERWAHINCNTPAESRISLVSTFSFGPM